MSGAPRLRTKSQPSSGGRSAQLWRSKLTAPQSPASQVLRTALCERVCDHTAGNLVLIQAPAGFGKTTLMLQAHAALRGRDVPTAWLTVDAADNDVGRFIKFLSAAIAMLVGREGDRKSASRAAAGLLALGLLADIATARMDFALFIDDLEQLENPACYALLCQVIAHLPQQGRVIIGSRSLPDLDLARLRAPGQVLEITSADLRFSPSEAGELLQPKRGRQVLMVDVARLREVTEGWPAALWLAAVALERGQQPNDWVADFMSSDVGVAERLAEGILADLSPRVRDFVSRTSILSQFNADLCNALLGIDDGALVLEELERAGLLRRAVGQEDGWFLYDSALSSVLRTKLERLHPQVQRKLHRGASSWFRAQQRPIPAIEHALASGDGGYALSLLDRQAEQLLVNGRLRRLLRLTDASTDGELMRWPRVRLLQTWALSMLRGGRCALRQLERVEAESVLDDEARSYALALRPMLLTMLDRFDAAYAAGQRALDRVRPVPMLAFSTLRATQAGLLVVMGRYASARELLDEAQALQPARGDPFLSTFSKCLDGVIELLHGRLPRATARFREAAGIGGGGAFTHTNGNTMAGLMLAEVLYEQNELADADRLLNVYVPLMQEIGLPDYLICGYRNLARIAFHRGDRDTALQVLAQMELLGRERDSPRLVASAQLEQARLALWGNDVQGAGEALERASVTLDWSAIMDRALLGNDADTLVEGRLRWMIHSGAAADAVPELQHELQLAERAQRLRRALRLRILLALALDGSGNGKQALRTLLPALRFSKREGFVRTLLDEGEPLFRLIRKLTTARRSGDAVDELAHCRQLMVAKEADRLWG